MKNKCSHTGVSGSIAYVTGFIALLIYARLIYFVNYESGSLILAIIVCFAPFVLVTFLLINAESKKKRVNTMRLKLQQEL